MRVVDTSAHGCDDNKKPADNSNTDIYRTVLPYLRFAKSDDLDFENLPSTSQSEYNPKREVPNAEYETRTAVR
jgi:hypothetical protein